MFRYKVTGICKTLPIQMKKITGGLIFLKRQIFFNYKKAWPWQAHASVTKAPGVCVTPSEHSKYYWLITIKPNTGSKIQKKGEYWVKRFWKHTAADAF